MHVPFQITLCTYYLNYLLARCVAGDNSNSNLSYIEIIGEGLNDGFVGKAVNRRLFYGDDKLGIRNFFDFFFVKVRLSFNVYPHCFFSSSRHTELMQYLLPPFSFGPSSKTWPRWAPLFLHLTSVRTIPPLLSGTSSTFSRLAGSVKLGQPVPESNLVSEEKSSLPNTAHLYIPFSWVFQYLPVKGCSVSFLTLVI